jgi:hypothetical protein
MTINAEFSAKRAIQSSVNQFHTRSRAVLEMASLRPLCGSSMTPRFNSMPLIAPSTVTLRNERQAWVLGLSDTLGDGSLRATGSTSPWPESLVSAIPADASPLAGGRGMVVEFGEFIMILEL